VPAHGPDPPPFRAFVVKVHSRCNLACDHCYVYEHADQSWRDRPVVMSDEIVRWTVRRIAEHCEANRLTGVQIVLHGGEPLLAGPDRIRRLVRLVRTTVPRGEDVDLLVQTNGILLDDAFCELFATERVKVGISLDGDRAANDLHRRYADGRSSYGAVVEAVRRIGRPEFRSAFAGLLCTIDPASDPVGVYDALRALDPPRIDFLLPHATWDDPPRRSRPDADEYADWLLAVYERWALEPDRVPVRLFDSILRLAAGGTSLTETVGPDAVDLVVVETDGAIEQADSLKTAYAGAPATGFHVRRNSFDQARFHPGFVARSGGVDRLCRTCRTCPVVGICGGGLYAHRFRSGTGFDNPSVYCRDLLRLTSHVRDRPPRPGRAARVDPPAAAAGVHALAEDDFDVLATGRADSRVVASLTDAQRSRRRLAVARAVQARLTTGSDATVAAAWETLADIDERTPVATDPVLGHPYVGVWARGRSPAVSDPVGTGYLCGLALAAALRAGEQAAIEVPQAVETLTLPSLGAIRHAAATGPGTARGTVRVETDPSAMAVIVDGRRVPIRPEPGADDGDDAGEGVADWQLLRHLERPGVRVALDDLDPYRDCYHHRASLRQTRAEWERWQRGFVSAWDLLEGELPQRSGAIAAGLRAITPLDPGPTPTASATHREAFGAVAVTGSGPAEGPDAFGPTLALGLLHEYQHLVLGAVLDLFELTDSTDRSLHHVGWRPDRRPIAAVLQGAYAHLAVVEFWRSRVTRSRGAARDRALATYLALRDQTRDAVAVLAASGGLTPLGRRWLEGMQVTVHSWYAGSNP
jgi:uncharacterized protein